MIYELGTIEEDDDNFDYESTNGLQQQKLSSEQIKQFEQSLTMSNTMPVINNDFLFLNPLTPYGNDASLSTSRSEIGSTQAVIASHNGHDDEETKRRGRNCATTQESDDNDNDEENQQIFATCYKGQGKIPCSAPNDNNIHGNESLKPTCEDIRTQKKKVICVLMIAVMIVVSLSIGMVFIGRQHSYITVSRTPSSNTLPPTPEDLSSKLVDTLNLMSTASESSSDPYRLDYMIDHLTEVTDVAALVFDQNSPQYKARVWLMNIDTQISNTTSVEQMYQRFALAVLYFSTNGEEWASNGEEETSSLSTMTPTTTLSRRIPFLNPNTNECTWTGITCRSGIIIHIDLSESNLQGRIPEEIGILQYLLEIRFNKNSLSGTIPKAIYEKLNYLYFFDVSENQLSGTIPQKLWSLPYLRFIFLYSNQFTGKIYQQDQQEQQQPEISTMLEQIWLHDNQLTGTIPSWINQLQHLESLILFDNRLTGTLQDFLLPSSSTNGNFLRDLSYLDLHSNQLSGSIPDNLFDNHVYQNLQQLYLNDNKLSGPLPNGDENSNLKALWLQSNSFSGTIPDEFGRYWPYLEEFLLYDNTFLQGKISACEPTTSSTTTTFAAGRTTAYWPAIKRLEADCSSNSDIECTCCSKCH